MATPKAAAAALKGKLKKIESAIATAKKRAGEPLKQPMPPGAEGKAAPLLKELMAKADAIMAELGKFEDGIDKYAAKG
jgi:hypothetical protein